MHRVGRWLDRTRSSSSITSNVDTATEARNMEMALKAVELIMDDDIPGAEAGLAHGDSAFHKMSRGTLGFMKATLGFEQDTMKEATGLLAEAEASAYEFHQKAQHDPHAFGSTIYPKGSEFALCQAEAQIMNAVVGVLNESLTESIRGFYKLRKAYLTLEGLAQHESDFMKAKGLHSLQISRQASSESVRTIQSVKSVKSIRSVTSNVSEAAKIDEVKHEVTAAPSAPSALRNAMSMDETAGSDIESPAEFHEADDAHKPNVVTSKYEGYFDRPVPHTPLDEKTQHLTISGMSTPMSSGMPTPAMESPNASKPSLLTADADSEIFKNSLDIFIHSGVNLMSGLINLMLSVIPPAFGRLLSIIGFRGNRERGLKMLWQASKFHNINGGMAALVLFGWYNSIIGFCDIITDSDPNVVDDVNGFPLERMQKLLVVMRQRYPKSFLWKLEEARSFSNRRQISKALEILCRPEKAQMKQLEALHQFETSINAMNGHEYELCAKSFLICIELNKWSQALYYYACAAAHLQIYRDTVHTSQDKEEVEKHRALAEKYFKHAPTAVGKKKMMGRQLPFDTFVTRKINKWTDRSKAWGCTFIEAVGVAPLEEVMMVWNGFKKMNETQLNKSLANLAWSEDLTKNPYWEKEDLNERAILGALKAICLRNLRRHDEAKQVLEAEVLKVPAYMFKGSNRDEWPGALGYYEMAVNFWMQRQEYVGRYGRTLAGAGADTGHVTEANIENDAALVAEAKKHIERAKNWGSYELDTRIGMKITAGHAAILRWETKHVSK